MLSRLVHVDCHISFQVNQASSMYQVASFGRGSAHDEDLEQLPVDSECGIIFHCRLIRNLGTSQYRSWGSLFLAIPVLELWVRLYQPDFLSNLASRIRQFAFPELFAILPLNEFFQYEFLEVLFLVAPILLEAWPAFFETFHFQGLYGQFPDDWNGFVFEVHE